MKPNLFVIGAMKSGTSSLHDYLGFHPEIVMSTVKEPEYFQADGKHWCEEIRDANDPGKPSLDRYLQLFPGAEHKTYAGESSTWYTAWPTRPGVAGRLHAFNPEARLIYIVRDPVERAISHYWFSRQQGWVSGPPALLRQHSYYWHVSSYAMQLRQYLKYFARDQIYVMTLEELHQAPAATMGALFRWLDLELPPEHGDARYSERQNPTQTSIRQQSPLGERLRKSAAFGYAKQVIPVKVREAARDMIERRIDRDRIDMTPYVDFLRKMFTPDSLEFEELCGRQFREWTTLWGREAAVTNDGGATAELATAELANGTAQRLPVHANGASPRPL